MILDALLTILKPINLIWFLGASFIGIVAGALPGIGASLTMSLLIPITFFLPPELGLTVLVSSWAGAVYGGSITAILINTPGTGGNVVTSFDGFPMAREGRAKTALGISATASMLGGLLGTITLIIFAPILASFVTAFGPAENFLLALFGLCVIATTMSKKVIKGLISVGVGLMLSFIGYDIISGHIRYDFGTLYLQDGINFLTVVIGLHAVSQAFSFASETGSIAETGELKGSIWEGMIITVKHWKTVIKSAFIGIAFGFIPGVGISAASAMAYTEASRTSKNSKNFGNGEPEGVVAPETANNAVQGGALIPTLTLGIPGNSDSAVFLAGLMMYGICPGRDLFERNSGLVAILFAALLLSQIAFWICGLSLTKLFAKLTVIPLNILMPIIWILSATGAFALRNNIIDSFVIIIFGVLGYMMKRLDYSIISMMIAVILGPLVERNFMRALLISNYSYKIFFNSVISWFVWVLIILVLISPVIQKKRKQKETIVTD